jgi:broad specificity phosphatase PhoE
MSLLRRVALVLLVVVSFPMFAAAQGAAADDKLVFIVRHAEKANATDPDPSLSDPGKARAIALAATLRDANITDILVTPRKRTHETADPLSDARQLTMHVVGFGSSTPEHVAAVAAAVRAATGNAVLVVGHSNTVHLIIEALGGPRLTELCDAEYDNLFVVRLSPRGPSSVVRAHYGAPDPVGSNTCAAASMR